MPADPPGISVVIIAKNEQATIRRCVRSVMSQSVPVREVIIVDGNSTDQTYRYAAELARQHDDINLVSEDPNSGESGPAAARNTGARLANSELLLFINGDVTIGPDYVARLLKLMGEHQLDAAAGLRWNVRHSMVGGLMNVHYALSYDSSPDVLTSPAFLSSDAMLIKAEAFWAVGGYDASMPAGEDVDLGYRLRGAGSGIGYDRAATIWHEGSHYRTVANWFKQLRWYGLGAASLARAHSWRMERERAGLHRNLVMPASKVLLVLLLIVTFATLFGPFAWAIGALGFTVAGLKYVLAAAHVQRTCNSIELPTRLLPIDIVLYPLFRTLRYAALSAFTWHALFASAREERARRTEDSAL